MPGLFVIVRDPRGSLVHVRKTDGGCVGCIEVGLYEIVRTIIGSEGLATPGACSAPLQRSPTTRMQPEASDRERTPSGPATAREEGGS